MTKETVKRAHLKTPKIKKSFVKCVYIHRVSMCTYKMIDRDLASGYSMSACRSYLKVKAYHNENRGQFFSSFQTNNFSHSHFFQFFICVSYFFLYFLRFHSISMYR